MRDNLLQGDKKEIDLEFIDNLKFDEKGLIPAVVQDIDSKEVLMLAYMNKESMKETLINKKACYFSRSRETLWTKGETSGNTQELKGFYYDCDKDDYFYIDKTIEVTDNALLNALTTALKSADSNELMILNEDVYVKSGKLDRENNLITVDLSPSYYNILRRVGSSSESGMLHSMAYTYGYNYGVDKVIITIDGKPYNGSHILLEENESIPVITTDIQAFSN